MAAERLRRKLDQGGKLPERPRKQATLLGMMSVLQDTVDICRERGHAVGLATILKDDSATFDAVCVANTIGTFRG